MTGGPDRNSHADEEVSADVGSSDAKADAARANGFETNSSKRTGSASPGADEDAQRANGNASEEGNGGSLDDQELASRVTIGGPGDFGGGASD